MEFTQTPLNDLLVFKPTIHQDTRGHFFESWNNKTFQKNGIEATFVQDNQSKSQRNTLRGMHLQIGSDAQAKLVRVLQGKILDIVVDCRKNSSTYKQSFSIELSADNQLQLFIPRGFAHGFVVLSETAEFFYKCDNYYVPSSERGFRFDDQVLKLPWPKLSSPPILSQKDSALPTFEQFIKDL